VTDTRLQSRNKIQIVEMETLKSEITHLTDDRRDLMRQASRAQDERSVRVSAFAAAITPQPNHSLHCRQFELGGGCCWLGACTLCCCFAAPLHVQPPSTDLSMELVRLVPDPPCQSFPPQQADGVSSADTEKKDRKIAELTDELLQFQKKQSEELLRERDLWRQKEDLEKLTKQQAEQLTKFSTQTARLDAENARSISFDMSPLFLIGSS
jgi:hypothetical protein